MPQPVVDNRTRWSALPLFLADEEGRPLVSAVIQATFAIAVDGALSALDPQPAIDLAGAWWGEPDASSPRLEPQTAFVKPGTDVVLLGHACAPRVGTTRMSVSLSLGALRQVAQVVGDRRWVEGWFGPRIADPAPFERIPLTWERAFGGCDRSDPAQPACEPRNPVGIGFHRPRARFVAGAPLPNLEHPQDPVTRWARPVTPVGFGFVAPSWDPRRAFAGTYDAAWSAQRQPLLPTDFDRRFFNAAAPGLVASPHLRGDEPLRVEGVTPEGVLACALPGLPPPMVRAVFRRGPDIDAATVLDTVLIDADARTVALTWRVPIALPDGPHDLATLAITASALSAAA